MVNIYIVTKKQDIFNKLEEGFSNTAYMEITSFKMNNLDELVERIDNFKDVDIALISEDILEEAIKRPLVGLTLISLLHCLLESLEFPFFPLL